jgi:alpha-beta hydrolase superfamily lysophospholipase
VFEALDAYTNAMLAADPRSGELGGQTRLASGWITDLLRANPQFDASKITVPALVIRGSLDTFALAADNQLLVKEIGAAKKKYVEIPGGSHYLQYEKVSTQFFEAVREFLEEK